MSRSKRKPYYKDNNMSTQEYWQRVRSNWNQQTKKLMRWVDDLDELDLKSGDYKDRASIVCDWDYCDWRMLIFKNGKGWRYWTDEEYYKACRK